MEQCGWETREKKRENPSQNVLTEADGPTTHAKHNIQDPLTAFHCLVNQRS